jgi:siroheme synthase
MLPSALLPPTFDAGTVWPVGAGPGDSGLLTLHVSHALIQAEIVLHDAQVPEEIFSLAARCRLEPVAAWQQTSPIIV